MASDRASRVKAASDDPSVRSAFASLTRRLGRRYASCTLGEFDTECHREMHMKARARKAKSDAEGFLADLHANIERGRNLLLYGSVGTGKDHILAAMAIEAAKQGKIVIWQNASDLFTAAKATWGKRDASVTDILKPLWRCDVLALSDPIPNVGELDRHETQWLIELIDRRYRDMRSTWVTMNATDSEDAARALSGPVVDRLRHEALIIEMRWESYRRDR